MKTCLCSAHSEWCSNAILIKTQLLQLLCWQCAKVLWNHVDSVHTFLVDPTPGMCEEDAHTSGQHLTFVRVATVGSLQKYRWYACSQCHSRKISPEHVGDVFSGDLTCTKPVTEWDMCKPQPIATLQNTYETGQVSLAGLLKDVKDAGFAQHVQGEVRLMPHTTLTITMMACLDFLHATSRAFKTTAATLHPH